MKLMNMLFGLGKIASALGWRGGPGGARAAETPAKIRTPEEAKARRKAYKRRKAAKAARRRNRK